MQQDSSRALRVGELLRRELTMMLHQEVKDPRVSEIVIYDVVVSNDLGIAKIYFSPLDIQQDVSEILQGLESAGGFLRTQLSKKLQMRKMPELRFMVDDTEAKSDRIEQLINKSLKS